MISPGSVNPADLSPLDPVEPTPPDQVGALVRAARAAQPAWEKTPRRIRNDAMRSLGRAIVQKRSEIAEIMRKETGRTATDALMSEVVSLIPAIEGHIRAADAALADEPIGLSMLEHPGRKVVVEAVPRGVIAIIAPWNYPLMNFFKSLFPALLAGNALVLKPSEWTPRTGAWLAGICREVLPEGLVQLAQGDGTVGAALLDAGVDGLVFTGSLRTGKRVAAKAGELLIPCSLELGGKDAAIVLADCNLERTVSGIGHWAMHNAGQDCASVERVYVEAPIADRFVAGVKKFVSALRVSPDEGADIGPLQNEAQLRIVEDHVEDALAKGATLVCGGKRTGNGYGFQPTVLDNCRADMKVMQEETFGPVLPVQRVAGAEEALGLANDNAYGLGGSIWTGDVRKGAELARRLQAGMCWVNNHCITSTMPEAPWTGMKGSGPGVAQGPHAYATFVRRRVVLTDTNSSPDAWWFPANPDLDSMAETLSQRALGSIPATLRLLGILGRRVRAIRAAAKG